MISDECHLDITAIGSSLPFCRVICIKDGVGAKKCQLGAAPCHFGERLHPHGVAEGGENSNVPGSDEIAGSHFQCEVEAFASDGVGEHLIPLTLPLEGRRQCWPFYSKGPSGPQASLLVV